jgi:hypothetical protein
MKNMRVILLAIAVLWSVFPAWPATRQFAVTTTRIAEALSKAGVDVTPDRVSLLADVLSTTPSPALKVRSVEKNANQQIIARMECEDSQECLPFFVGVKAVPGEPLTQPATANPRSIATSYPAFSSFVLRTGSTATLQLDGEHIHITIPVICLENGAVGQSIRVTDKSRKLVYRAEVVDGGLVKGRLR